MANSVADKLRAKVVSAKPEKSDKITNTPGASTWRRKDKKGNIVEDTLLCKTDKHAVYTVSNGEAYAVVKLDGSYASPMRKTAENFVDLFEDAPTILAAMLKAL